MDFRDAMRSGWIWVLLDPELVVTLFGQTLHYYECVQHWVRVYF